MTMNVEILLNDIFRRHRLFLPGGEEPSRNEVRTGLRGNILLEGLTQSEAMLVLSTLPKNCTQIYFSPLDKGLSKAKVYSGRYKLPEGQLSKTFVFKIGPKNTIKREYEAVSRFVTPYLQNVSPPIYRVWDDDGLIVQDFAGTSTESDLVSLKECVRTDQGSNVVSRLLRARLGKWYQDGVFDRSSHHLGDLFKPYLSKAGDTFEYPEGWGELKNWVQNISDLAWSPEGPILDHLKISEILSPTTIVHGDLHSQNVLVDDRQEAWPIDFAWCRNLASPILDFTMLECSLKFLGIPQRSDLQTLIRVDSKLLMEYQPQVTIGNVPYHAEISNVVRAVMEIRRYAEEDMGISWPDYRKALSLMTYAHSSHRKLNRPFVLASLQMAFALESLDN